MNRNGAEHDGVNPEGTSENGRPVRFQLAQPGTRLAGRYLLEEVLEQADNGVITWRAVDEMLARPVGVHTVPVELPQSGAVIAAARSASMLTDPRFLRVLDVHEAEGLVYVVQEWITARSLAALLHEGPLAPAAAASLAAEVAGALAAAHQRGLAHLRLGLNRVLQTDNGDVKIVGIGVDAALAGLTSEDPAAADARAAGAVLYAALTARWPDGPVAGLPAAQRREGALCSPRQVRAGVPTSLDDITMRALGEPGTPAAQLRSPAAVAEALRACLRSLREGNGKHLPQATVPGAGTDRLPPGAPLRPRPTRTTRAARLLAGALLVGGLALAGWQLAAATLEETPVRDRPRGGSASPTASATASPPAAVLDVVEVSDFDPPPGDGEENSEQAPLAADGDPGTAWRTVTYFNRPNLGGLKEGVGLLLDLGSSQQVGSVALQLVGSPSDVRLFGAEERGESLADFTRLAKVNGAGSAVTLRPTEPAQARYLLVWLTELPADGVDAYRGGVAEAVVRQ